LIFPLLINLNNFFKSSFTWLLVFINLFWFILMMEPPASVLTRLNEADLKWIKQVQNLLLDQKKPPDWLENYPVTVRTEEVIAYKLALEPHFLASLHLVKDKMEPVEYQYRQRKILSIQSELSNKKIAKFGFIGRQNERWATWFTYQFMHANFTHILSNMSLLILVGSVLERMRGGAFVLACYLFSGLSGVGLYYIFDQDNLAPLIGASASVTGIIGAYLVTEKKRFVSFFYFLSFQHFGKIYLPTFVLFFYFFLDDLAAWMSQNPILSDGVAHVAHLGGFIFGVIFSIICSQGFRLFNGSVYAK